MKKVLLLISFFVSFINAQSFQIKQITNLNADCRNISRSGARFYGNSYYVFEAHKGNSSSIYFGNYLADADSFAIITKVTDDNYMNINPQIISTFFSDTLLIIYQTNRNGNWDIAYNIYTNNQLSPIYYIANSDSDEINPCVQFHYMNGNAPEVFMHNLIFYQIAGSVWVKNLSTPKSNAIRVFSGDSTTTYSQTSFGIYGNWDHYYITAKKITKGKSSIVVNSESDNWVNEEIVADTGNVDSPEFQFDVLTYNNDLEGKKNIYLLSDITKPKSYLKLITTPNYDYFNFKTDMTLILAGDASYYQFFPYSYQVLRNDSAYIRINLEKNYPYNPDTLVYTKVKDSKLLVANMGYSQM